MQIEIDKLIERVMKGETAIDVINELSIPAIFMDPSTSANNIPDVRSILQRAFHVKSIDSAIAKRYTDKAMALLTGKYKFSLDKATQFVNSYMGKGN